MFFEFLWAMLVCNLAGHDKDYSKFNNGNWECRRCGKRLTDEWRF